MNRKMNNLKQQRIQEQRERDARIARLRNEQERLKEIERQQEARLQALGDARQRMEEEIKQRYAELNAHRISLLMNGNPEINAMDEDEHRQLEEACRANDALRRKSEEVDYELEAAQSQTERLRGILRTREAEVQALRERVEAQRQEWARRQHQNYQN